jgi:hypothetical protein
VPAGAPRSGGPADQLDALLAPAGQELLDRLAGLDVTPATELAVGTRLRRDYPSELVAAALAQHELRGRAAAKFSRADRMLFTRAGLEQATAEPIARHRAARFAPGARLADLCCGIGGDLIALGVGREVLGVDRDPVHLRMAELNAAAYGVAATTRLADVREVDLGGFDGVFVDPARRRGGRRTGHGDSDPPLDWSIGLASRVPAVAIKAAPGLPHEVVPAGWEAEFVADRRELKEAVLWSPALATATTRATVLPGGHQLLPRPGEAVPQRPPGRYLLDPSPAVTRAGLVEDLARELGAWKIDDRIAFLSSEEPLRTPFARTLQVLDSAPWEHKALAQRLRALDVGSVDVRRRGLAGDVQDVARRLKLRGRRHAVVVMTRVRDRPWALVCGEP